ncbi:MAG: hypothetical protein WD066_19600 [Planctomycetaceae bacterium]
MKNLIAQLKGRDFKRLAIDHGEKIGFGVVVVIVLLVILGTQWSSYGENPQDLSGQVAQARQAVENTDWPKEERLEYARHTAAGGTFEDRVAEKIAAVPPDRYEFPNRFFWDIKADRVVVSEPRWLALADPIATADRVVRLERPEPPPAAAPRFGIPGGAPLGQPAPANPVVVDPFNPNDLRKALNDLQNAPVAAPVAGGTDERRSGAPIPVAQRVVAVRAILNLLAQQREIEQALNQTQRNVNQPDVSRLEIDGFELERQEAVPGPDPWSGPWELADIGESKRVLTKSASFAEERLNPGITDSEITSPMPELAFGQWGDLETHPKVAGFHYLDPTGIELQERLDKYVIETRLEEQRRASGTGYGDLMGTRRLNRDRLFGRGRAGLGARTAQDRLGDFSDAEIAQLQVSASGNILLFRHFDFSVEPGKSYRYRVRVRVRNPNFGKPPEQVASPDVALGEFRFTPWSEATPPVTVPPDTEYFVREVRPGRPGQPVATFHLYQWYSKIGTMVRAELRSEFGALIGGEVTTEVAHPGDPGVEVEAILRDEKVQFITTDTLVDVADAPRFDRTLHADLGQGASVVEQALVAGEEGRIESLDPVTGDDDYQAATRRFVKEWFETLRVRKLTEEEDFLEKEAERFRQSGGEEPENLRQRGRRAGIVDSPARRYPGQPR